MKNVEIIKYKGNDYLVDYDKMTIYRLADNDFETYKAALRKPSLANQLRRPSQKFLDMLARNSNTYNPAIHAFNNGGGQGGGQGGQP